MKANFSIKEWKPGVKIAWCQASQGWERRGEQWLPAEKLVFIVWSAGILPGGLLVHTRARSPEAGFSILDMEALLV